MSSDFNTNLRRIRKEKKITQEQLAEAIGVSPQAVSKWETSSYPDAQLLPGIADFLGVTIDELFGRAPEKEITMEQRIVDAMRETPTDEKITAAYKFCRAIILGTSGNEYYFDIPNATLKAENWECHIEYSGEYGWLQARLPENLQYFILMPQPKKGYDDVLAYNEEYVRLFRFLSQPDALRAMYYFAGHPTSMFFTSNALASALDISAENAEKLIAQLENFRFIWGADLKDGTEKEEKAYQYLSGCNFAAFMATARTLIHQPNNFQYHCNERSTQYFWNDTYKKKADDKNEK